MKRLSGFISILLCAAMVFSLSACTSKSPAGTNTPDAQEKTEVKSENPLVELAERTEASSISLPYLKSDSFDPYVAKTDVNRLFMPLIFESLFSINADGTVTPDICSEIATANNYVYKLTINERYFSDGTPVTLEDVAYSVSCAKGSDSYYKSRLSDVTACYVSGDTVVIELKNVCMNIEPLLTFPICKNGNPYVGTGYYQKHTDNDTGRVTLTPNLYHEDYEKLSLSLIELVGYDDVLVMADDFSKGKLACMSIDYFNDSSPGHAGDYDVWKVPTNTMVYIGFNIEKPIFSLSYSRYVVGRAIDRETIASEIYGSMASPSCLAVPKTSEYYSEEAVEYGDYMPELIPGYLKARGYRDYEDDGLINAETYYGWFNFSFDIIVNSESEEKTDIARSIARELSEYGIAVEVRPLPWDDYVKALADGDYYAFIGEVNLAPNYNLTPLIGSYKSLNYSRYGNEKLDQYLANGVLDEEFWEYFLTCAAISPIVFKYNTVLSQRGAISNLEPNYGNFFNNILNAKFYE